MAEMSPMCSIIVASAMGMMVMMAVTARPGSKVGLANRPNTVFSHATGSPTHGAATTPEKSTSPKATATAYETTTPMRMGTILIMPRPQMLHTTIVTMATMATTQFVWQFVMAELARINPIEMTIGPVTTGGK